MTRIVIPYRPRPHLKEYHSTEKRFTVTVAHRRFGKTVARVNRLIKAALSSTKVNPRYFYLAPYLVQAKDIAWAYFKHYLQNVASEGLCKFNEAELSVTLLHNNAIIRLYGGENMERMRGVYFDGGVVDEAQGIAKHALTTIILPTLADRQGWLDISGTPKGWQNLLGELVKLARERPDEWFLQILKASETKVLPQDELDRQRSLMSDSEYEQEYECNFDSAITGAVYGKWIAQAETDNRIIYDRNLHDERLETYTAFDLGFGDATAIWWYQVSFGEIRWIDYHEAAGEGIEYYLSALVDRPYRYAGFNLPHDAANKLLAAGGRSIAEQMVDLGKKPEYSRLGMTLGRLKVWPSTSQANSIEALRKTLETSWFDGKKCAQGLEMLRNYQFEYDHDRRIFRDKPKHDLTSHAADAAELVARCWKPAKMPSEPPRGLRDAKANEIFWPKASTSHKRHY